VGQRWLCGLVQGALPYSRLENTLLTSLRPFHPLCSPSQLETDIKLLIPKALAALERYGHQVVIGNTLVDRKYEVVFVERSGETWVRIAEEERGKVGADGAVREIEEDIIERLERMHSEWVASGKV
jgi:hypothetical protein